MRFKFRAWDREKEVMMPIKLMDWDEWWVSCNTLEMDNPLEFGERNSFSNEKTDRHIIMQYTGVKDRNNKEIFEGDLVKGYLREQDSNFRATVVFEDGMFRLKLNKVYVSIIWEDLTNYNACELEVIGNIHEGILP